MQQDKELVLDGVTNWYLDFPEGQNFSTLNKEVKVEIGLRVENARGSNYTPDQLHNAFATIKLRGNSTASWDKKPANISLLDGAKKKKSVPLLGMPVEKDWCLLASAQDKTFIRTVVLHRLARILGMGWSARCKHIATYWRNVGEVNYQFQGLYTVTEKVESGPDRIAISETADLTTDYVVEQQPYGQLSPTEARFQDIVLSNWYGYKVPDGDDVTPEQTAQVKTWLDDFHYTVLNNGDWQSRIDMDSMASFFLVENFTYNMDAAIASWYYTIKSGKVYGGPVWDADGRFGMTGPQSYTGMPNDFSNPIGSYVDKKSPVFAKLMQDPSFAQLVADKWKAALPELHALIAQLRTYVNDLYATGLVEADRTMWPQAINSAEHIPQPNYAAEIDRVEKFIRDRAFYFTRGLYDVVPPKPVLAGKAAIA